MRRNESVVIVGLLCALCAFGAPPIQFPPDGGIVDVTKAPYLGRPDGISDCTRAIQAALDAHPNGNRIIYLAPGTWVVTDTLKWPAGSHGGLAQKRTILQGAGPEFTTILLPDSTAGFSGEKNKALIWTGSRPAQRFRNAVRDLAIDVGRGNPSAIGLQFNASNQGCVRNVELRAADGSGAIGLDMGHTDEIGPLLVRNLTVRGFEIGISTKWPLNSATFEHITLRGQRKHGWWNYHQMVFIRGLDSENAVPAIFNEKDSWGTVTLLDSRIAGKGADAQTPGILNQRQMYLRNVSISGYSKSLDHADKGRDKGDVVSAGLTREDTSHANVFSLFREVPDRTFATAGVIRHLPVKESPEIPWGDIAADWASIVRFGADPKGKVDSSHALQAAIDSGAKTVFIPGGARFRFDSEVQIRGPVERIIGLEGRFTTDGGAVWRLVDRKHPGGLSDAPAVIIERCSGDSGAKGILIRHESARALVVSSWLGAHVEGRGAGDLFLDDFCGRLDLMYPGQSAWCRQLNTEREGTMLRNSGGKLWILGMKTEKIGTIIETINGGITDAAGIFVYSNRGWVEAVPAFVIRDSTAMLAGINERNFNRRPVSFWFLETQGRETRAAKSAAWVYLSR